jgi:hypothetical protein
MAMGGGMAENSMTRNWSLRNDRSACVERAERRPPIPAASMASPANSALCSFSSRITLSPVSSSRALTTSRLRRVGAWIEKECGMAHQGRSGLIALLHPRIKSGDLGMENRQPKAVSRKLDPEKQAACATRSSPTSAMRS